MTDEPLRLLKVPEAAALLNVGRTLVYDLINKGEIPSLRIGGARRIPLAALLDYIARQTEAGGA